MATTPDIVPSLTSTTALTPPLDRDRREVPIFGQASQTYIDLRIGRDGADHPDIGIL